MYQVMLSNNQQIFGCLTCCCETATFPVAQNLSHLRHLTCYFAGFMEAGT